MSRIQTSGPDRDNQGRMTNNGLRNELNALVGGQKLNREHPVNSADYRARISGDAAAVRGEMKRRSRTN